MKTLSSANIQHVLNGIGISYSAFNVTDRTYVMPSYSWITRTFKRRMTRIMEEDGLLEWTAESGDCEDLAFISYGEIRKLNGRTIKKYGKKAGISACVLFYTRDEDKVKHAVIGFLTFFKKEYKLIIIDRQGWRGGTILCAKELSEAELNSCSFCVV